ncbi:nucleotidyltransferase family protein [Meridianimarinicoccus aquatilis]|uniref:Nucleotidyltransferase family protein n=1 Tax=Meridianimarinicoccus aquatilis TaxID=2552766 RepID=A0A4R6ALY2_9RHOB|nr:nucleotidyltransferase family protein [Fluviibacterium aquatile]TDL84697.1 nucleotidyltransferase family protein [Fluviibacterium aquatile]
MSQTPEAIMLFAAGFGTRMGALTKDCPKAMIHVGGRPLLDHALALADVAGIQRRVVNTHYLADQVEDHLAGRDVAISREQPDILETGGGLRAALPLLGAGPVFTLNTDAIWTGPNPLTALYKAWDPSRMKALLLLVPAERALGHTGPGDFAIGPDGRITRGAGYVYTGAQIIDPTGLSLIRQTSFSLNQLWDRMSGDEALYGTVHKGGWCDVGRPEGIAEAEAMLANPPALLG